MNQLLTFFALLSLSFSVRAQVQMSPLAPSAVPAALKRSGRVVQALRYTDRTGTYTVLATEIAPRPDPLRHEMEEDQRADLSLEGERAEGHRHLGVPAPETRAAGALPLRVRTVKTGR